jgi:predicted RNA binding protein YcfA (HicA-like mRNA interferase family)
MEAPARDGLAPRLQEYWLGRTLVIPHPKKDLGKGLVRAIYKGAGWKPD